MSPYKHLTLFERERIMFFKAKGYKITQIAEKFGRNKSTISRELKRNSSQEYLPAEAEAKYQQRRKACKPHRKLEDPKLYALARDLFLVHQWSSEEIAGRLKYEHKRTVSYNTIYREIYAGTFDDPHKSHGNRGAVRKLRHHGKSRHTKNYVERRGKIKISNPISERPKAADKRQRLGDWEADTVVCKRDCACLVTLADRKSRFLICAKADRKNAVNVGQVMIERLKGEPLCSITPDRGKEFARHAEVSEALEGVKFYFPLPHHPWQRGTNENTNGLLREYFPHGKDISDVPDAYIQAKVDELNKRPRKCLGYKTPYEVYYSTSLHLV